MILPKVEVKKILYATDLSDNARYAFAYAADLANLYGAGLTLLHVLPEVPESLDAAVEGYISTDKWDDIKQRTLMKPKRPSPAKEEITWPLKKSWITSARKQSQVKRKALLSQTISWLSGEIRWNKYFYRLTRKTAI